MEGTLMAYCSNCGKEIADEAVVCPACGVPVATKQKQVVDDGGFLWGLLGFCVPLAGLILYLVWKTERPNTAKAAGMGALISVGIAVLYYIIMMVLLGATFGGM